LVLVALVVQLALMAQVEQLDLHQVLARDYLPLVAEVLKIIFRQMVFVALVALAKQLQAD
jgi:hypothetical protein